MAFEKLLILESTWAEDEEDYIRDSRSASKIYAGFEALLSVQETPVFAIVRPLLTARFKTDIEQFVALPANCRGPNVIILSAHGQYEFVTQGRKRKHRRTLQAIDGELIISVKIRELVSHLKRTIFILDACDIGEGVGSFLAASQALGVIGFSDEVNWIDSSTFILALLLKYQEEGVFQMERVSAVRPQNVLADMHENGYGSLMDTLSVNYKFRSF